MPIEPSEVWQGPILPKTENQDFYNIEISGFNYTSK